MAAFSSQGKSRWPNSSGQHVSAPAQVLPNCNARSQGLHKTQVTQFVPPPSTGNLLCPFPSPPNQQDPLIHPQPCIEQAPLFSTAKHSPARQGAPPGLPSRAACTLSIGQQSIWVSLVSAQKQSRIVQVIQP